MSYKITEIDGDMTVGHDIYAGGKMNVRGSMTVGHTMKVDGWLDAPNVKGGNKGLFRTVEELKEAYPKPEAGWYAGVGTGTPFSGYVVENGEWVASGGTIEIDPDTSALLEAMDEKVTLAEAYAEGSSEITGAKQYAEAAEAARDDADGYAQDAEAAVGRAQTAATESESERNMAQAYAEGSNEIKGAKNWAADAEEASRAAAEARERAIDAATDAGNSERAAKKSKDEASQSAEDAANAAASIEESLEDINTLKENVGYYACDTEGATVAKVVVGGSYTLPSKAPYGGCIKVKFSHANSAESPTLSIGGAAAKPLYYDGMPASESNTWADGETVEVYYDGAYFQANNVAGGGNFATGEKVRETGIDDEPTAGSENLVKSRGVFQSDIEKDAKIGYYEATILGGAITVNAPNYKISVGGNLRIKMPSAGTTASTLTIGNANDVQLWYNGAAVSTDNSWEAGDIVIVFYDGTRFMASNSQGGGGNSGDGAFDVSAKYPTSGVDGGNTYTLDGALAVLDANLPANKKKGGMSVKFIQLIPAVYTVVKTEGLTEQPSVGTEVQESLGLDTGTYTAAQMGDISLPTNLAVGKTYWMAVSGDTTTYTVWYICLVSMDIQQYVQFRLLSTSWNTDVTNWQGVADGIIEGSVDLAKSGDVSAIISKLMPDRIAGYTNKDLFKGGYYSKNSGEYIVNPNYCSLKVDITTKAKYIAIWNYRSGNYYDGVLFFDANDEYIQDSFVAGTTEFKSVKIPDGASKVAINSIFSYSDTLERVVLMATPLFGSDTEDGTAFKTGELVKDVSIEQTPTSGSHNLVESGGIYKSISKLSGKIYGSEGSVIDLDDFESHNGYIINGVYRTSDATRNYKIVDVEAGKSIRITANDNYDGKITFLKSYPDVIINNQTPVDFCEGITEIITVYKTIPVETVVPDDCKYLYVLTLNGTGKDSTPSSIKYLAQPSIEEEIDSKIHSERIDNIGVSINVFGDVLPEQFKTKLVETNDDLLIACQGDSVTGRTQDCNPSPDVTHDCPGGQYQSFVYLLQKNVGKKKPYYNRLDSQRNDADFFTKTGTWEQDASGNYGQGIPSKYEEASVTCLTFKSNNAGASVGFAFDADTYEKCNIIFSNVVNAGSMALSVQEGNGKLLASIDRETWVEANGFSHSQQLANREGASHDLTGEALCQRHRRLWLKKADSTVTGTLNITYSKVGSDSNYVYCWGTEMYSGRGIFFDNIGRGGKSLSALKLSISDIFDRNPDLTILEMPLANDTHYTTTDAELLGDDYYRGYFLDETNGYSYKVRSENYTKYPIIVVLPHTRGYAFDEDDNAVLYPEGYLRTAPAYDIYKMVWAYLRTNLKTYNNVRFVDMCDQFLNEAKYRYGSYHDGISAGCMTYDTIHLNQRGADVYNKYLAPIFQV